jgi:hypothetical protein
MPCSPCNVHPKEEFDDIIVPSSFAFPIWHPSYPNLQQPRTELYGRKLTRNLLCKTTDDKHGKKERKKERERERERERETFIDFTKPTRASV